MRLMRSYLFQILLQLILNENEDKYFYTKFKNSVFKAIGICTLQFSFSVTFMPQNTQNIFFQSSRFLFLM